MEGSPVLSWPKSKQHVVHSGPLSQIDPVILERGTYLYFAAVETEAQKYLIAPTHLFNQHLLDVDALS